ncbi:MAG TPA: sigma factor [Stellaceae bacterium]|nr:sigma factor [Stellaceae bacterium]
MELTEQLPFLRLYARRLTHDREHAADLLQDTCEKAWRRRDRFAPGTHLRAWMVTIMRHNFADERKRSDALAAARVPIDALAEQLGQPPRAERICFAKEAVNIAAARLSPAEAAAFWPAVTGAAQPPDLRAVPKATIATRLHRARRLMHRACSLAADASGTLNDVAFELILNTSIITRPDLI